MRRAVVELIVGSGLLLGPLAYALSIEAPVEVVVLPGAPAVVPAQPAALPVIPAARPVVEVARHDPVERLEFAFVTEAGIVLDTDPDAAWATGSVRKHRGAGQVRAGKRVDATKVPASLWSLRGRSFDLYGAGGKVCRARLGEFTVVAQHDGPTDYDLFAASDPGFDDDAFQSNPPTPREIRSRVWKHPDVSKWLVAEVLGDASCDGALWARDADLPPPQILRASKASADLRAQRIAALEASETYATTRAEYEAFREELDDESRPYYGPWSQVETEHPAKVQAWLDASDVAQFVEIDFGEDEEGCGDGAYTRIAAMDAVVDGGFEDIERTIEPIAIFDADLDGAYEMLYGGEDRRVRSASPTLERDLTIAQEWVCPC